MTALPSIRPVAEMVHVVCLQGRVEVFDDLEGAREFAAQDPASSCQSLPLRHGIQAAVVVDNRRVVVRNGCVKSVSRSDVLDFYDDVAPPAAEVEMFEKEPGEWHVLGFGVDRPLLAERLAQAVATARLRSAVPRPGSARNH